MRELLIAIAVGLICCGVLAVIAWIKIIQWTKED